MPNAPVPVFAALNAPVLNAPTPVFAAPNAPVPMFAVPKAPFPVFEVPKTPVPVFAVPKAPDPVFAVPKAPVPALEVPNAPVPVFAVPNVPVPVLAVPKVPVPVLTVPNAPKPMLAVPNIPVPVFAMPNAPVPVCVVPNVPVLVFVVPKLKVPAVGVEVKGLLNAKGLPALLTVSEELVPKEKTLFDVDPDPAAVFNESPIVIPLLGEVPEEFPKLNTALGAEVVTGAPKPLFFPAAPKTVKLVALVFGAAVLNENALFPLEIPAEVLKENPKLLEDTGVPKLPALLVVVVVVAL